MNILCAGKDNFFIKGFIKECKGVHKFDRAKVTDCESIHSIGEIFGAKKYDAAIYNVYDGFSYEPVPKDELMRFRNFQYAALRKGIKKLLLFINPADLYPDGNMRYVDEIRADRLPPIGSSANAYLMTSWASFDGISNVLRFYHVFGEGNKSGDMLTKIIHGGMGKKGVIRSHLDMTTSGIYLGDAYKIINKFLENDYPNGSYNLASDEIISYYNAATKTVSIANKYNKEYTVKFLSFEKADFTCRNIKLVTTLGGFKFTSLSEGISAIYKSAYGKDEKPSDETEGDEAGIDETDITDDEDGLDLPEDEDTDEADEA